MSLHSLTNDFLRYRNLWPANERVFWPIYRIFEKLVADNDGNEEFVRYLLNDTIAWAIDNHKEIYSPNFLFYRVDQVRKKYDADKKALEEEKKQQEIQTAFVLKNTKEFLEDDLSQFE